MLLAPVSAQTLSEQVVDRLIDAIATRQLLPGQRLIETELAETLEVSRVPVREALRELEHQGIVVTAPRRGLMVGAFDATWAAQLWEVRLPLERQAAALAAPHFAADPQLVDRLDGCIAALEAARLDWLAVNRADVAFHTVVFEVAGSALLTSLWRAIAHHVLVHFAIESNRNPDFDIVLADHRLYRDLLAADARDQLGDEIARHIAGFRAGLQPTLTTAQQGDNE
jgi:DNA-binding GntR family transcriptional regulator